MNQPFSARPVIFNAKYHTYKDAITSEKLTSVSKIKGAITPPFDPTGEITKRCAEKEGIGVTELKQRWQKQADESKERGTYIHKLIEDAFDGNVSGDLNEIAFTTKAIEYVHNSKYEQVFAEQIISDHTLPIAGTADLILQTANHVSILDWKTDKSIERYSFGYTRGRPAEMLKPPFDSWHNCNFSIYSVQLSIYAWMLERQGFIVDSCTIAHVDKETLGLSYYAVPFRQLPINETNLQQIINSL